MGHTTDCFSKRYTRGIFYSLFSNHRSAGLRDRCFSLDWNHLWTYTFSMSHSEASGSEDQAVPVFHDSHNTSVTYLAWFTDLLDLSISRPLQLPTIQDLLCHPMFRWLHNQSCYNSKPGCLAQFIICSRTFEEATRRISGPHQHPHLPFTRKMDVFVNIMWAKTTDPFQASASLIADFLLHFYRIGEKTSDHSRV